MRCDITVRILIISVILAVDIVLPSAARSQSQLTFVPSLSLSTLNDDNIFTTSVRSADQMTLLTPSFEGSLETPTVSILSLYSFDMQRSFDHPALNNIEARRHGMIDTHFRRTPKLTLGFGTHYDRSDTAGELNFETSLLLERRRASRWELTPSLAYQATPLVTIRGQYDWTREDLEDLMVANEHVARVGVSRQLSTRTSVTLGYLGRFFINGDETEASHAALVGWTHRLQPFTMLTLQAGPRLSSRGQLAPEIVASLAHRAPGIVGYAFDYWRGESIILGVLGPVELQSGTGKFTWPVRSNIDIGAAAGLFNSVSLSQGQARIYHAEMVASWSPGPYYTVAASYGVDFQHGDIRSGLLTDKNVMRHVFLVKLTVAPRLSRAIQPTGPVEPMGPPTKGVKP
jgi:hypothetical protein